jgi:UDP-glucose 4-epimerase
MRILVTGAGGFVGARLALDLAAKGHEVTAAWFRSDARLATDAPKGLRYEQADLSDGEAVDSLFARAGPFDAVVHAAARVAVREEDPAYLGDATRANVLSQANLVGAALRTGCERYLFASTISVYGNRGAPPDGYLESDAAPTSYYGWSKRAAEQLLDVTATERSEFRALSLRLAGVHGKGRDTGALAMMARAALKGVPIRVNDPSSQFRWVFIEDVSQAVASALSAELPAGHRIANLASADIFMLTHLAERLKELSGSNSPIEHAVETKARRNEVMNIEVAKRLLGYVPTRLDEALQRYLEELRTA